MLVSCNYAHMVVTVYLGGVAVIDFELARRQCLRRVYSFEGLPGLKTGFQCFAEKINCVS